MKLSSTQFDAIQKAANEIRVDCLRMGSVTGPGGAHFGSALSMVEIMAVLYTEVMKFDSNSPLSPSRDRFILSKGHGSMSYYAALKLSGFVTDEDLMTFKSNNTFLYGHPSMDPEHGIEFSTGSLGLGLGLGVGTAIGLRLKKNLESKVIVLMGDGECNEGSVWETCLIASHQKLENLICIIDKNNSTDRALKIDNIKKKFLAFGWDAIEINGHSENQIFSALSKKSKKPLAIIAHTTKGKGIKFMENNPEWHHKSINADLLKKIKLDLLNS